MTPDAAVDISLCPRAPCNDIPFGALHCPCAHCASSSNQKSIFVCLGSSRRVRLPAGDGPQCYCMFPMLQARGAGRQQHSSSGAVLLPCAILAVESRQRLVPANDRHALIALSCRLGAICMRSIKPSNSSGDWLDGHTRSDLNHLVSSGPCVFAGSHSVCTIPAGWQLFCVLHFMAQACAKWHDIACLTMAVHWHAGAQLQWPVALRDGSAS